MSLAFIEDVDSLECYLTTCWLVNSCVHVTTSAATQDLTQFKIFFNQITDYHLSRLHVLHTGGTDFEVFPSNFETLATKFTRHNTEVIHALASVT